MRRLITNNTVALAPAGGLAPTGSVTAFAATTAPTGWLLCDGSAISRTIYVTLFAVIGTTYGTGDGSTTFNVPDLRGRVPAGLDNMGGSAASRLTNTVLSASNTLGATGGAQTYTLSTSEMPSHTHTQNAHNHAPSASAGNFVVDGGTGTATTTQNGGWWNFKLDAGTTANTTATNQNTGGGGAHNNTQPTLVLAYIIKA